MKRLVICMVFILSLINCSGLNVSLIIDSNDLDSQFTNYTFIASDVDSKEFESMQSWSPSGDIHEFNISNLSSLGYVYIKKRVEYANETVFLNIKNNRSSEITINHSVLYFEGKNYTNWSQTSISKVDPKIYDNVDLTFDTNISNNGSEVMLVVYYKLNDSKLYNFTTNMTLYEQATGQPELSLVISEQFSSFEYETQKQLQSKLAYIREEDESAKVTIYAEFPSDLDNSGNPKLLDFINYSINLSGEIEWFSFPKINLSIDTLNISKNWGENVSESFKIQSIGNAILKLNFSISDNNFSLDYDYLEIEGDSHEYIHVRFTPNLAGNYTSILTIYTNDMENQEINITLNGYATAPQFNSTFSLTYFETDSTYEYTFVIRNNGDGDLKIDKIDLPFWIDLNVSVRSEPLIIPKNSSVGIMLWSSFKSIDPNDVYSDIIEFRCNDPENSTFTYNVTAKWTGAPEVKEDSAISPYILVAIIGSVVGCFAILGVRGYQKGMERRKLFYMIVALLVLIMMILSVVAQII